MRTPSAVLAHWDEQFYAGTILQLDRLHDFFVYLYVNFPNGQEGQLLGRSGGRCRRSRSGLRCRRQRVSLEEVPHQVVSADLVERGVRPVVSATIDGVQLNCRALVAFVIAN